MRKLARFALSVGAAALAACGGLQPPIAASDARPQSRMSVVHHVDDASLALEQSGLPLTKRYEVVHGFTAFRDGAVPENLIIVGNHFYGTTFAGGFQGKTDCKQGCGVVFSMAMDGSGYRVLHRFQGGTDGAGPTSITLTANVIFGVTYQGGGGPCPDDGFGFSGCGTVFKISPDGSRYAQLHALPTETRKGTAMPQPT